MADRATLFVLLGGNFVIIPPPLMTSVQIAVTEVLFRL